MDHKVEFDDELLQNRTIFLCKDIEPDVSADIISKLITLNKRDPNAEITIIISSDGGDVNGLFAIYDIIQYITNPIKTIGIGDVSSSAGVLLACGTKGRRFASPHSDIMLHSVSSEISGTSKEIDMESKRIKRVNQKMLDIISKHTGQSLRKVKRDCKFDKYFTAQEAIKYGIVDEILPCNKL